MPRLIACPLTLDLSSGRARVNLAHTYGNQRWLEDAKNPLAILKSNTEGRSLVKGWKCAEEKRTGAGMRMTKVARPPPAPPQSEKMKTTLHEWRGEGPKCQLRLYDLGKDENADDDDAFLRLPKLQSNPDSLGMRDPIDPTLQRNARCVQHHGNA